MAGNHRACAHCGATDTQDTSDRRKCLICGSWSSLDGKKLKFKQRGGATYMTSQSHLTLGEEVGE